MGFCTDLNIKYTQWNEKREENKNIAANVNSII